MSLSPLWTDIEWNRDGRQGSFLNLEHSVHRSAYGLVSIPVSLFKNGSGPTLLLMAGSHGDEYEGQAILTRLIQTLDYRAISGRIIVLPAANLPAAMEGTRTSPLDAGNLNRCFGDMFSDSPTSRIANYITNVILPMCDVVFDFHSGGSSLDYLPCTYASVSGDSQTVAQTLAALEFMNAPIAWIHKGIPQGPEAGRAAYRQDVMYLSGEFGGGGRISRRATWVAERAIYRLMAHLDLAPLPPEWGEPLEARLMTASQSHYFYADHDGVFEPAADLGDDVRKGELAGTIFNPETPARPATQVTFPGSGIWICARAIGRVRRGDCLGHLLTDISREEILVANNEQ
ncbi:succinylglutamate desuccinylase/aspartoacylase family protein [Shinella daejeonensis]|uniref:succinylglutamate desuccinylase/aspartoacylase family protein n=1 Tax=Shinella daejeonensis TaxID=659017 RepID=UPI0020C76AE6|nr:succinylglutamate desuccinylase/aspartoacylase family protein [Shinella daejeonensis]MCP8894931.1 succinylglutamate desuccinylase/aspartoacylase family protein [Shinella daejeonensis]